MTVKELIEILNKVENKDLIVCVEADHGQTPMKAHGYGEGTVESLDQYMMEYVDDEDTAEPNMFVIQGY